MQVRLASGPGGTLFVSIPRRGGSIVALLDRSGQPHPGWPMVMTDAYSCDLVLPVDDGSVRVGCRYENPDGRMLSPFGAFALDSAGRVLPGWPIVDGAYLAGRVEGDELTVLAEWPLRDLDDGRPTKESGLVTVTSAGATRSGVRVPLFCCQGGWAVGPTSIAYGVGGDLPSEISALDSSGMFAGFPLKFDGIASGPAIGPEGDVVLAVGSPTQRTSEVVAVGRRSAAIPIVTVTENWADTGGCSAYRPQVPLVAPDGTIFVFSEEDRVVVALDPSLEVIRGWPYRPATPLVQRDERYVKEDAYCPSLAPPAVGPDSTLYLPLQARGPTVGASLVAVGLDGKVRPGWPVELKRAGSEFWSVVVGSDGTAYALAVEPEETGTSSATILAIAPDSTVSWTSTVIEP